MNKHQFSNRENRNRIIIRYNMIGIVLNLILSFGKILIGLIADAHAIILDGLNSLSDLLSSVITILSAKIGSKKADESHPFGFGRMEYVCTMVITAGVMYVGIRGVLTAINTIIHPHEAPRYDTSSIVIMTASFISKLIYGIVMRYQGRKINSSAMIITGIDSLSDSLIAASILAGIMVCRMTGVDIEHYLCLIIASLIIKTSITMARECVTNLLGTKVDSDYKRKILNMITSEEGVLYVCNLVIHNYGEEHNVGAVDIEVDENMKARDINQLTLKIKKKALEQGLMLTSVGIIGTNTKSPEAVDIMDRIIDISRKYSAISKIHSFMIDPENKTAAFYIVHDFSDRSHEKTRESLRTELYEKFPDYTFIINSGINI